MSFEGGNVDKIHINARLGDFTTFISENLAIVSWQADQ